MHLLLIKDEINRERMFDDFAPTLSVIVFLQSCL
jgi:hypothetical protein